MLPKEALLLAALACAGCAPATPTPSAIDHPTPVAPRDAPTSDMPAPQGWDVFLSEEIGFRFAYPDSGTLSVGSGTALAMITFAADPAANVVEESISISGIRSDSDCVSPLAEGWAPADLSPEMVEVNGVPFLRQTHAGVAAGTSSIWIAYTAQRDERCVSLGYELRTFDPANLDPTRFPTLPVQVDIQEHILAFEAIVATFVWLG